MKLEEKKKNIALLAGGDSGEYEVSIASTEVVKRNLDTNKYNIFKIILRGKDWYHEIGDERIPVDKSDFTISIDGEKIIFDLAFIVIHGTPGEDGKLQGYFDLMGIPYTSPDLFTSAATFKKSFTNAIVAKTEVNIAQSVSISRTNYNERIIKIKELDLPLFVKPNKGGSSVGVSKVNRWTELEQALNMAFNEDNEVLVEEFIEGRELACGIIKYKGEHIPFPVTEIISKNEFFDYEAKYSGKADEITPANITEEELEECHRLSKLLYDHLDCKGLVRFDYFLTKKGFYFLEVNTIPGLSAESLVPQQIRAMGRTESEIYDMMIEEALA